jgi:hypothetical protein
MRVLDWLFPFTRKEGKNRATAIVSLLASDSGIDSVLAKATNRVMLEVSRRRFVLRVLKTPHATCTQLAFLSGTGKEVTRSAVMVLEGNLGFEECINWRPPGFFEVI